MNCDCERVSARRGGRAVDRTGLENRRAERSREFESHPLRHLDLDEIVIAPPKA